MRKGLIIAICSLVMKLGAMERDRNLLGEINTIAEQCATFSPKICFHSSRI